MWNLRRHSLSRMSHFLRWCLQDIQPCFCHTLNSSISLAFLREQQQEQLDMPLMYILSLCVYNSFCCNDTDFDFEREMLREFVMIEWDSCRLWFLFRVQSLLRTSWTLHVSLTSLRNILLFFFDAQRTLSNWSGDFFQIFLCVFRCRLHRRVGKKRRNYVLGSLAIPVLVFLQLRVSFSLAIDLSLL